jgi:hypothetical protein
MAMQLFFTGEALVRELNKPPSDLEQQNGLFANADGADKLLLLVVDHDVAVDGQYLTVVGGRHLGRWQEFLPAAAPDGERVRSVHAKAIDAVPLRWTYFSLRHLTPHQLLVRWSNGNPPADDPVLRALYGQLLALSLIYSANQSKQITGGGWRFTYGAGQVAELAYPDTAAFSTALAGGEPGWSPWEAATTLAETVLWAYEDTQDAADRLPVLQSVIGERLQSNDADANGRLIVRHAASIHLHVEWSWQTYIEGKLKLYFDRVRQVEDLVAATVDGFSQQARTLTKGLADSMLAGIAVVVGSFLGAIFGKSFNVNVFRLGTALYAAYLALFPGLIGLVTAWQHFSSAEQAFAKREKEFKKRLFAASVDDLVGTQVQQATKRFRGWFWLAVSVYALVAVLLALAAVFIPDLIGGPPAPASSGFIPGW